MNTFDFDKEINRHGTGAIKTDGLSEFYGRTDLEGLWIADMDFAVTPEITEALQKRLEHPIYGYTVVPQSFWDSITSWLSRRHGWDVRREEMIFVNGIVRGIGYAINYFTRPGDKVLIQPPVYHPFRRLTEDNGRVCVTNPLIHRPDGDYEMDFADLEEKFATERPVLMVLCNPHNPGGKQWSADELARVAKLAKKYGVKVISDEIHADLMLFGKTHVPFMASCPEACEVGITMGAPSKTFNIAGIASSWIVIKNPEIRDGFFHWMTCNEFSDPTFVATIATEAAYNHGEKWLAEVISYLEGNIIAVEEFCRENLPAIKQLRPEASFLVWLDCRGLGLPHDELVSLFVDKAHLALNDGAMFGSEGDGFMRLNIASPRSVILRDLATLAEALK